MGQNVIDDAQVVFSIESESGDKSWGAGTEEAKIILSSVTLTIDRPTNGYSGIGNEGEIAVGYGTRSASMSHEQIVNEEAGKLLADLYQNDRSPKSVSVTAGDVLEIGAAKFDWNSLEVSFEDDGDATVSIDGKIREVDIADSSEITSASQQSN